jgi:hypothetical protein
MVKNYLKIIFKINYFMSFSGQIIKRDNARYIKLKI